LEIKLEVPGKMQRIPVQILFLLVTGIFLNACSKEKPFHVPELSSELLTEPVTAQDIPIHIPTYGISVFTTNHLQFEVNIEREDTPKIHVGQKATAYRLPQRVLIPCVVEKILPNVSTETGQSLAWLKPISNSDSVRSGEFIYATITIAVQKHALTVPAEAIFIRDGKTWVIRKTSSKEGKLSYDPALVKTGESNASRVEITAGIKPQDTVVTREGIGFLYPDFKVNEDN
jgi:hypothetical protein